MAAQPGEFLPLRRASRAPARSRAKVRPDVLAGAAIAPEVERRVVERVLRRADEPGGARLDEVVYETIYAEEQRLAHIAPDPRSPEDRAFVAWLRQSLARADKERQRELVARIVERYTDQISGYFDPRVYAFATRLLPPGLGALLHGLSPDIPRGESVFDIESRVRIEGELGALRSAVERGTVVLVPTHSSNLDSVLIGYVIDRIGLPPFAYGAGLNLFTSALIGYFMRNLGAYTVDRKKTDPLYRDTLKEYATLLLERGQHSLFFPGGTRSRSGAVETHLKLGLLGTAPVAFRRALEAGAPRPRVFVVPCTITYPLVLEASSLIDDYLRAEGGPHYVDLHDEFERPRRWADFLRGLFQLDLQVHVRFGRPLDPLGNEVDDQGQSRDPRGRIVDPSRYLLAEGKLVEDPARDAEYTRLLALHLVAAYRRDTVVLPTSLVAFVVFEKLRRLREQPDLFRLLRGSGPGTDLSADEVREDLGRALDEIDRRVREGEIRAAPELAQAAPDDVLDRALATFGTYHPTPVIQRLGDRVRIGDANLLLYYRNRLEGLGLLGAHPLAPTVAPVGGRRSS